MCRHSSAVTVVPGMPSSLRAVAWCSSILVVGSSASDQRVKSAYLHHRSCMACRAHVRCITQYCCLQSLEWRGCQLVEQVKSCCEVCAVSAKRSLGALPAMLAAGHQSLSSCMMQLESLRATGVSGDEQSAWMLHCKSLWGVLVCRAHVGCMQHSDHGVADATVK